MLNWTIKNVFCLFLCSFREIFAVLEEKKMDDVQHTGQGFNRGWCSYTVSVLEGDLCITTIELAQAVKSYQVGYTAISV